MNRKRIAARIVSASACVVPVVACALIGAPQAHAAAPAKPITIQIGAAWPTDGDVRDEVSNTGIYAGLGYTLPTQIKGRTSIDLDFAHVSGHGARISNLSLFVVQRIPLTSNSVTGETGPYVGLGIGATRTDVHVDDIGSDNDTKFAGKAVLGFDMGNAFIEASYILNGKFHDSDVRSDTVNLSIGTHI